MADCSLYARFLCERESTEQKRGRKRERGCPVLCDSLTAQRESPFPREKLACALAEKKGRKRKELQQRAQANAIIKTSNEFYVCACGLAATIPKLMFSVFSRVPVARYRPFFGLAVPCIEISDDRHPLLRPPKKPI